MSGNIFDRKEELKLRESMGYDAKKMAEMGELWSAPPPLKELEIKLTHYQHENQQLTLSVVNNLLVRQLKERIVEEVGRGQVSKIMLSISGENALNDDVALSSLENEIQGGLLVMGIDMSKGKEVKVKLVHAASDSPQSLTLTVLDTATMLEIRKITMQRLEESSLSKCKLVRRLATGGFQGLADDERLNKKRELLFLGRELPEDGVKPEGSNGTKVEVSKATKVAAPTKAEATKTDTEVSKKDTNGTNGTAQHKEHKESVLEATANEMQVKITHLLEADQEMHLSVFSDFLVRELKELIVAELGHGSPATIILSSNGDNVLHDQFPLSKYAREIEGGLLITGIELKKTAQQPEAPQAQVEVKLVHASNSGQSRAILSPPGPAMDTETTPVSVTLLSGRTLELMMPGGASIRRLKFEVEKKLKLSLSKLLYMSSETSAELDATTMLQSLHPPVSFTAVVLPDRIASTRDAFAYLQEDGHVSTWSVAEGSNNREVYQLEEVKAIQSTDHAFSAIKFDGTVISWGHLDACSGNHQVRHQLRDVHEIQATAHAFAAIRTDGSVVTWPVEGEGARYGGDSNSVQNQLTRIREVQASRRAFAALTTDANVVTWGAAEAGGDSRSVQAQLRNVTCIQASHNAFAALREDGCVIYWPAGFGGDSSLVLAQLHNVVSVQSTSAAFAALRSDGTVVAWGDPRRGGDLSDVRADLHGIQRLQASARSFAALRADGSVVVWPYAGRGFHSNVPFHGIQACMNLTVSESCKILDLRRAALSRLGEKSLLKCKIVKRAGSTFASLPDGEGLKGRREFLFLGRDLPADGNGPFVDDNKAKEVKVLSTSQQNGILRLLEEIERALQTESVQKNLARSRKENSDPAKVRALLGPLFASACMDPLRKHGTFQVSKKGFEDFFAAVWMCRTRSEIVSVAHRIEGLLGLSAGDWFGIEKK
eukprot:symbB.v1.2.003692.t1/scaffold193.1/size400748/11